MTALLHVIASTERGECGRVKQSRLLKFIFRMGDRFAPSRLPLQVLAMTVWDEGLLHATSHSIAGVHDDGLLNDKKTIRSEDLMALLINQHLK